MSPFESGVAHFSPIWVAQVGPTTFVRGAHIVYLIPLLDSVIQALWHRWRDSSSNLR